MNTVERVNSRKVKTCAQSPRWSLFLAFLNLRRWFTGLNMADSNVRIRLSRIARVVQTCEHF